MCEIRLRVGDPPEHGDRAHRVAEGTGAGSGVDEHGGQREHIGRRPGMHAHGLLGRHESGGSHEVPGGGDGGGVRGPCDPEVDQTGTVGREQNVRRLEVTVHDSDGMQRRNSLGKTGRKPPQLRFQERAIRQNGMVETRPPDILSGQPWLRGSRIGIQHTRGPGSIHRPSSPDLAGEAGAKLRVIGQSRMDDLDGRELIAVADDRATEVDPTHSTCADTAQQPEGPQLHGIAARQRLHSPPSATRPRRRVGIGSLSTAGARSTYC